MRVIYANYSSFDTFKVPKSIPLLSVEENDKVMDDINPIPWSWWIKWGVLYYYDAEGKQHQLEPMRETSEDYKRPRDCDEGEEDSDDEEEESE